MHRTMFLSGLALALLAVTSNGADWSRFRGPNGSGIAGGKLPAIDPKKPLWKTAIPGKGVSSPIIVNGKVFMQTASIDGQTRTLLCLDAGTGKVSWTRDHPGRTAKTHNKNSLASSTPACDGQQVYCVWWDGSGVALNAYDMTGKEKWNASLGGFKSQHGPGMSPVVHDGLVFVNVDDDERAELIAFDTKTGAKKWVAERKHYRASYSSPYILKRGDRPEELLLGTTTAITSYNPATGAVNWQYDLPWPKGTKPLRVIGHPTYASGLLVISGGDGDGSRFMLAIDPDRKKPEKVWSLDRGSLPYVPCMIATNDMLFWIGDKPGGWAACADPKTGKTYYSQKITTKEPSASPILVGDQMLMVTDDGEIVVFAATKEFELVSQVSLGEGVFASPAAADGKLYIRGTKHLYCFGK